MDPIVSSILLSALAILVLASFVFAPYLFDMWRQWRERKACERVATLGEKSQDLHRKLMELRCVSYGGLNGLTCRQALEVVLALEEHGLGLRLQWAFWKLPNAMFEPVMVLLMPHLAFRINSSEDADFLRRCAIRCTPATASLCYRLIRFRLCEIDDW